MPSILLCWISASFCFGLGWAIGGSRTNDHAREERAKRRLAYQMGFAAAQIDRDRDTPMCVNPYPRDNPEHMEIWTRGYFDGLCKPLSYSTLPKHEEEVNRYAGSYYDPCA